MSTHRHIDAICAVVLVLTLLITVLFMNGERFGLQVVVDEDAEVPVHLIPFTENDKNGAWDTTGASHITLNGDDAFAAGGAYTYDGNVIISSAGKYVLSGTLNDGSIIVDTSNTAKVWILLDSVNIRCSDGACLDVEQADKVFLSLAEGSENSLSTLGFSPEHQEAGMDGAIFARDDLTVNGSGSLTVSSAGESGIVCNDELVITGGKIAVTAAMDALHVNDDLRIMAAELDLNAGDDGISLTGPESEFYFESGLLTAKADGDGINAENHIRILGGAMTLEAGDDGISAGGTAAELQIEGGSLAITASDKGIGAGNTVRISGGTVTVDSEKDGISAAGDISVSGGELTINAADDGIHSDTAVSVSDGRILIPKCYEGIEAVTIDVSGGDITIYPEDDGLNANGGIDLFGSFGGGPGGMPGGRPDEMPGPPADFGKPPEGGFPEPSDRESMPELTQGSETDALPSDEVPLVPQGSPIVTGESAVQPQTEGSGSDENRAGSGTNGSGESWIHISGGSITVVNGTARDADGLDSNGDILVSGGVIRVSLVNSGSNSALDCGSESGGVMEISGGELVACGSYMMAEGFEGSSSQCSILYNFRRGAPAGTPISLEDSEGNVLLHYEVPCSFSSVVLSCPGLQIGGTYSVVIGDSAEEITLEEVSASFGDVQSEGFDGPMNWGGMHFRPESEPRDAPDRAGTDESAA